MDDAVRAEEKPELDSGKAYKYSKRIEIAHRKHFPARLQKVVPCIEVCLQHALIDKQRAHGLRYQDIYGAYFMQLLYLAVPHI